jgi:hypothetical protein
VSCWAVSQQSQIVTETIREHRDRDEEPRMM